VRPTLEQILKIRKPIPMKFDLKTLESDLQSVRVVFVGDDGLPAQSLIPLLGEKLLHSLSEISQIERFTGKLNKTCSALLPQENGLIRVMLVGLGAANEREKLDMFKLGGVVMGALTTAKIIDPVSVLLDAPAAPFSAQHSADFMLGMRLRAYKFETYKTKLKEDEDKKSLEKVYFHVADTRSVKTAWKSSEAIAEGVNLARTVVNEPPNVLTPAAFAAHAETLTKLGVEVQILREKELKKLGMRALLAVGQGSEQESHVAIMRWRGSPDTDPIAIIGKGVTFDTGGISIKPSSGMEDMKGDMAGAACVLGLMHTLAKRKASAHVLGIMGLVENMPDGNAQRPGDIVTSLSGQTIEIINTDAEGRLVLADLLWHVQETYSPKVMINLATLTGAILVALGQEHAGLFSNTDELADAITASGTDTGEKVWRMPLGKAYDKIIDSKFADMKNSGGRFAGSITAAQFLQRFVNEKPWAHLDIAGTGMDAPDTDTNRSWGSGWGVRLLNHYIAGKE
jgi:leucyl aminopeptidase